MTEKIRAEQMSRAKRGDGLHLNLREVTTMSEKHDGDAHYHELHGAEGHAKIEELLDGMHICMMTTAAEDGSMSSRPMAKQKTRFEGTMWFLTRHSSEKVDEIRDDQHILLTFANDGSSKYVALKGRARVNQDKAKIHELWNDHYKAWFPKGEDDPDIAVLAVDVQAADYWEATGMKIVMMAKYAYAAATGQKVALGEAGHVTA
jgi:general stress protein 26